MITADDAAAIRQLIERLTADIRVAIMAEVVDCDPATLTVAVKPMFLERIPAELGREVIYEEMQTIEEVPLSDIAGIRFLPPIGSHGLLLFHDVDLDKYKTTRLRDVLASARTHDYNDAIFLPIEITQGDRPDPYATLDGRLFKIHTNVQIEKDVQIDGNLLVTGDVQAGPQMASLVNLNTAYNAHTHTGNLSYATSGPASPAMPGTVVFVPYEEPPKEG